MTFVTSELLIDLCSTRIYNENIIFAFKLNRLSHHPRRLRYHDRLFNVIAFGLTWSMRCSIETYCSSVDNSSLATL
jgi:hypothetical protein